MQRLRGVIVALCFVLLAVVRAEACEIKERIVFEGFERVTHLSTSGMNLWVEVTNRSCWRMVVAEAQAEVLIDGKKRLTISLRDRVVVPRKSTSKVVIPLRITSHSMFSMLSLVGRIAKGQREDVTINYSVRAGIPIFKRTIKEESVPLDVLLKQMALPDSEIGVLKQLMD